MPITQYVLFSRARMPAHKLINDVWKSSLRNNKHNNVASLVFVSDGYPAKRQSLLQIIEGDKDGGIHSTIDRMRYSKRHDVKWVASFSTSERNLVHQVPFEVVMDGRGLSYYFTPQEWKQRNYFKVDQALEAKDFLIRLLMARKASRRVATSLRGHPIN